MALSTLKRCPQLFGAITNKFLSSNLLTTSTTKYVLCFTKSTHTKVNNRISSKANPKYFNSRLSYSMLVGGGGLILGSLLYFWSGRVPVKLPEVRAAKVFDFGSNDDESKRAAPSNRSRQFNFIADVVEKAAPAVVYIEIIGRHPYLGTNLTMSNGSGFIVQADGLIVTNAHVVANKPRVVVKLHDGRVFDGVVKYVDPVIDLATISIDAVNLPTLQFGRSAALRPGEWVIAMGSPLSLSNTVTAGVVSTTHRGSKELGFHNKNIDYIQTDASITIGNSGGPLVNLDGDVIGINTMKLDAGISFAIPSDLVQEFVRDSLEKSEKAKGWFGSASDSSRSSSSNKRRYMGITMLTLTPTIVSELQQRQRDFPTDVTRGVLIWKVIVGSPAYSGGLLPGDVVISINGEQVESAGDVYKALNEVPELRMIILRRQQRLTLTIVPQDSE